MRRGAFPSATQLLRVATWRSEMSKTLTVVAALIVASMLVLPTVSLADVPSVAVVASA